jgi:hypothetical protein
MTTFSELPAGARSCPRVPYPPAEPVGPQRRTPSAAHPAAANPANLPRPAVWLLVRKVMDHLPRERSLSR